MTRLYLMLAAFVLFVLALPALALAQAATVPEALPALAEQIAQAIQGGKYLLAVALGIMILIWGARKFELIRRWVPSEWIPLANAILAGLAGAAAAIATGQPWYSGCAVGIAAAFGATGAHQTLTQTSEAVSNGGPRVGGSSERPRPY